jgi:hypothetical protein
VVGLSAARGDYKYTLTWSAPTNDGGLPVTDYKVDVFTANQSLVKSITTGGELSATVSGVSSGNYYISVVYAVNAIGLSDGSAVSELIAPSKLSASAADLTASISGTGEYGLPLVVSVENATAGSVSIFPINNGGASVTVRYTVSVTAGVISVTDQGNVSAGSRFTVTTTRTPIIFSPQSGTSSSFSVLAYG